MAQEHGDRLSAVDASFLAQEGDTSHMHVGAVLDLRGPAAVLRGLLQPGARAPAPRPALPPEARRAAAGDRPPAVGRRPELQPRVPHPPHGAAGAGLRGRSCARWPRASTRSSSTAPSRCGRPWLVQGLEGDRFALISKTHHALVDGIAGVDLITVLFDLDAGAAGGPARGRAVDAAVRAERRSTWRPAASTGWRSCRSQLTGRALSAATRPGQTLRRRARGRRGPRRGRLGGPEPGARHAR